MTSSSPGALGVVFERERRAFQHRPRPGFQSVRRTERVDQALHAPLVDPVIGGLPRYPAIRTASSRNVMISPIHGCSPDSKSRAKPAGAGVVLYTRSLTFGSRVRSICAFQIQLANRFRANS